MSAIIDKLKEIEERYNQIGEQLISEEAIKNPKLMTKLAKQQAQLRQTVECYHDLLKAQQEIKDATELMHEHDEEIREMAEAELTEAKAKEEELLAKAEILLIPKDPLDGNNAILEIRGAAGGDEGNIFSGDLFRMYTKYAEAMGYKIEVLQENASEMGGYALISFMVKGDGAYGHLKFESGAHRVQRVPKTESAGRVHTSTATVLVWPDVEEEDYELNEEDLVIDTHRSSGAGGQHINKTDSAVRIVHIPTGITVNCQDGRSQLDNRATAMRLIRARVMEEMQRREDEAKGKERRSKIGTGDRSEKIRTYNYPQNRVTDHRIGLTINQLDRIMEGKLEDVIDALIEQDQKERLAQQ